MPLKYAHTHKCQQFREIKIIISFRLFREQPQSARTQPKTIQFNSKHLRTHRTHKY